METKFVREGFARVSGIESDATGVSNSARETQGAAQKTARATGLRVKTALRAGAWNARGAHAQDIARCARGVRGDGARRRMP